MEMAGCAVYSLIFLWCEFNPLPISREYSDIEHVAFTDKTFHLDSFDYSLNNWPHLKNVMANGRFFHCSGGQCFSSNDPEVTSNGPPINYDVKLHSTVTDEMKISSVGDYNVMVKTTNDPEVTSNDPSINYDVKLDSTVSDDMKISSDGDYNVMEKTTEVSELITNYGDMELSSLGNYDEKSSQVSELINQLRNVSKTWIKGQVQKLRKELINKIGEVFGEIIGGLSSVPVLGGIIIFAYRFYKKRNSPSPQYFPCNQAADVNPFEDNCDCEEDLIFDRSQYEPIPPTAPYPTPEKIHQ